MSAKVKYTAIRGFTDLGNSVISTVGGKMSSRYRDLHTNQNAATAIISKEANATTGFTSSGLDGTGSNKFESQSHTVNPNTNSRYAIYADANDTPTAHAGFAIDLNGLGCVDGNWYQISFWWVHTGAGNPFGFAFDESDSGGITTVLETLSASDTTWKKETIIWKHDSTSTRYGRWKEVYVDNNGAIFIDDLEIIQVELAGADKTELHTDSNAISVDNEANTTAGWTQSGLGAPNEFVSISVAPYNGTYCFRAQSNSNPTDGARFYKDIGTDLGLTDGDMIEIEYAVRHIGAGGEWSIRLGADNNAYDSNAITLVVVANTDTTYTVHKHYIKYSSYVSFIVGREHGSTQDGGIHFDYFSVKKCTNLISNGRFANEAGNAAQWTFYEGAYSGTVQITGGDLNFTQGGTSTWMYSHQSFNTVPGTRYKCTITKSSASNDGTLCNVSATGYIEDGQGNPQNQSSYINGAVGTTTGSETLTFEFTAVAYTTYIYIADGQVASATSEWDDCSVRPVIEDLSANNDGLAIYGELIKVPVMPGSEVAALTNFSANTYALQPVANFTPSTGSWAMSFWFKLDTYGTNEQCFFEYGYYDGSAYTTSGPQIRCEVDDVTGALQFRVTDDGYATQDQTETSTGYVDSTWHHCVLVKNSTTSKYYIYIDSALQITGNVTNATSTLTNSNAQLMIGNSHVLSDAQLDGGAISDLKIFSSALSITNVKSIYNTEAHLFKGESVYHVVDESYWLEFATNQFNRNIQNFNNVNYGIDRSGEYLQYAQEQQFTVTSEHSTKENLCYHREFYENVDNGQQFTFFPGSGFAPDESITCELTGFDYSEQREDITTHHRVSYAFKKS